MSSATADDLPPPADHAVVQATAWSDANPDAPPRVLDASLVEETAVALVYNGISHAVMLTTPTDLEDFAYGFSLTEGIIARRHDIYAMDVVHTALGIEVRMELASACFAALKLRRRSLAGRSGCGLCGVDSLAAAMRPVTPLSHRFALSRAALARALDELPHDQTLHRLSGGAHAAAWVAADGRVKLVREDVGRHNALDKLIGALATRGCGFDDGFVLMTSRASYEIVQKAATVGIAAIAALSAPTGMAVRLAEAAGVTLVGFARGHRHSVYTHPQRIH
ncbi:MAG TPA: formate dehydrogenase accessory sulfurtransferase FdhD [Thauera phenylacetica]|nr:formate dehydrogenase accessory sulfurtransferase FdhD [Thauera phenylacetica]